ncbi:hypothetical protein Goarm_014305 [Gossypium armourianum]|uniref:RNase H type-1 domain-containing protein n=1 Tax=Gossypium armourianum TaxID=34283 RepID=A0A7J9J5N5_9ROSI|nr:hypothetical protein [Gossypium armourianum]
MSLELVSFIRSYMGGLSVLAVPRAVLGFLRTACWHPLTTLLVKANFDAAYRGRSHSSCSGVVVRDVQGQVLGACTRIHGQVSLAFTVEALAILLVLEFTWDLSLSRVVFEGDSLHVICKLNSTQVESTMATDEGSNAHLP